METIPRISPREIIQKSLIESSSYAFTITPTRSRAKSGTARMHSTRATSSIARRSLKKYHGKAEARTLRMISTNEG